MIFDTSSLAFCGRVSGLLHFFKSEPRTTYLEGGIAIQVSFDEVDVAPAELGYLGLDRVGVADDANDRLVARKELIHEFELIK